MFPGLQRYHGNENPEAVTFTSFKMPATEGELRSLMMDMKKSYFNYSDHTLNHKDLYTLLSWMEDVISDSVKLDNNYNISSKKRRKR